MALQPTLKQIGNYPLLAQLGAGGMGTVYLALHRGVGGFEKKVALKCINPHVADDKQFIAMLVDEAKLTAQLTHPNIVQVIDLAHSEGLHYLVMEYVEGIDASTLAKNFELDIDEAVYLVAEAARGLAYAHRKGGPDGEPLGIVHRDISGHNLLVSSEGITKVLDFGIAKAASNRSSTQVGVLKGKLAYMSPEQASGKRLDARSDLFSLGIVLWELCTRQRLFQGDTDIAVLMQVQRCDIEAPSRIVDGFPRDLEAIIMKCLAPLPEHRYGDADRLADELHEFLRTHQGAMHPRAKLAQKVAMFLRQHPPKALQDVPRAVEKTPAPRTEIVQPAGADATLLSPRSNQTRVLTKSAGEQGTKHPVKKAMAIAGALWVTGLAAAGGYFWARNIKAQAPEAIPVQTATLPTPQPATQTEPAAQAAIPAASKAGEVPTSVPVPAPIAPEPAPVAALKPAQAAAPGPANKPRPAAVPKTEPKPHPEKTQKPPAGKAATPAAAGQQNPARLGEVAPVVQEGFLSINATPWARVYVNGKAIAESTPLLRHKLSAGSYKVVLVNPELRVRKEIEITVAPGEHVRQSVNLE